MLKSSTWRISFAKARQLYTMVVQLAIIYAVSVWYKLEKILRYCKKLLKEIQKLQNKCVRVVAGAYKATNAKTLENEIKIMLINIYMKGQILKAYIDEKFKVNEIMIDACKRICDQFKRKQN